MKRYGKVASGWVCVCGLVFGMGVAQGESGSPRVAFAPTIPAAESAGVNSQPGIPAEGARPQRAATTMIGGLEWHTDYAAAYSQAEKEGKFLFLYFWDERQPRIAESFQQGVLAAPELEEPLSRVVRALVPVSATIPNVEPARKLLAHAAFEHMQQRRGIAVLDFTVKDDLYGKVVSAHPFTAGKHYTTRGVQLVLNLPRGTVTQRALIYAVRLHPAAPRCTEGECHPALLLQANKGSKLMAQYEAVGHHDWGTRYNEVAAATKRSAMEVAAAAGGQTLIDAAIQCVDMWYGSPTHWGMMTGPCAIYGFDLVRSASGTWYGTGVFAN